MRKKILNHTCILVVVSVLLTFLAAGLVMYGKYNEDLKESVRDSMKYVQDGVEKMGNSYLDDALGKATSARITLLGPKGNVLFVRWRILQNLKITVIVRNLFRQKRMDTQNH